MTLEDSGTEASTAGGTEDTLTTLTTKLKSLVLEVDTAALLNGEVLSLAIYSKTLSGGTERLVYHQTYSHVQAIPIKVSPPVASDISYKATLTQTGGSTHNYPWKVLSL